MKPDDDWVNYMDDHAGRDPDKPAGWAISLALIVTIALFVTFGGAWFLLWLLT